MKGFVEFQAYKIDQSFFIVGDAYEITFDVHHGLKGICTHVDDNSVEFYTINNALRITVTDMFTRTYRICKMTALTDDNSVIENQVAPSVLGV